MKKILVIGGGFAGCATAHLMSMESGWDVTLVEAAPFLGAGNRTQNYGGHPHTFGPRHFLTPREDIYEYLNAIVPLRSCEDHEFLSYVKDDECFYSYPIHRDDIQLMPEKKQIEKELTDINQAELQLLDKDEANKLTDKEVRQLNSAHKAKNFEEFWTYSIGETLYKKFVKDYSEKMWLIDDNKLIDDFAWSPKGYTIKEGGRQAWDSAISAYPHAKNGYDDYFDISTQDVTVLVSTFIEKFDIPNKTVTINGESLKFDVIVSTISPDKLFESCHGELPYVGRDLQLIVLPVEFALPEHIYFIYYSGKETHTRVVEYKKFTQHESPTTLISIETPSDRNKHYPLPFESEKAKAKKYFDEMPDGVFSIGRAGSYHYNVDIDDTIAHAMKVRDALKS
ncbi:MAG: FAD-dependent oxidoreductase [Pseudomonadota bacterium]